MAKKSAKNPWLRRHVNDPYVQKAQQMGYRSRAVFKLMQLQEKFQIIKPGQTIVELGSAPGGWTQLIMESLGQRGKLIAVDILPMDPIEGVEFIQADFTTDECWQLIAQSLVNQQVALILSDMAPNQMGDRVTDQLRSIGLAEEIFVFAEKYLKTGGSLLLKLFHGVEFENFIKMLRPAFSKIKFMKPDASRRESREVYVLAEGYRANKD